MSSLPPPSFIVRDPAQVVADMTAQFEADAGKTLYPAQVETLYINQVAYRESLLREAIQAAGLQNLIDFATYPMLDYLGVFYGVRGQRLPAQAAVVTLQFTFPAAFDYPVYVPVGIRVASSNGLIIFTTQSAALLSVGSTIATVTAICSMTGIVGNGFVSGQISNLLDDVGVAGVTATNTTSSSGGGTVRQFNLRDTHFSVQKETTSGVARGGCEKAFAPSNRRTTLILTRFMKG